MKVLFPQTKQHSPWETDARQSNDTIICQYIGNDGILLILKLINSDIWELSMNHMQEGQYIHAWICSIIQIVNCIVPVDVS